MSAYKIAALILGIMLVSPLFIYAAVEDWRAFLFSLSITAALVIGVFLIIWAVAK